MPEEEKTFYDGRWHLKPPASPTPDPAASATEALTVATAALASATAAGVSATAALASATAAGVSAQNAQSTATTAVSAAVNAQSAASSAQTTASAAAAAVAPFAPGQSAAAGRLTVDAILEAPTAFAFASSYAVDTALRNDFAASGALTGNITFTFLNAASGRQGLVAVRQDATGGRTVTFTAPAGWTLYRDTNTANLSAAAGANLATVYTYAFLAVGGLNMLLIGKLAPVSA